MKITWNGREATGRFSLSASSEMYDGVPAINKVYIDRDMPVINNDVFGVAATLMFGYLCEGSLTLPKEVSPEAASSIEEFLSPARVRVNNIQYQPFANSKGEGFLYLDINSNSTLPIPNEVGQHRVSRVTVLDSSRYSGAITSMDGISLASNAGIVGKFSSSADFYPSLGVALLFAESLRARTIVLDDELLEDQDLREKLGALLVGCKMVLVTLSEAKSLRGI